MRKGILRVVESLDDCAIGLRTFLDVQTQMRKGFLKVEESLNLVIMF